MKHYTHLSLLIGLLTAFWVAGTSCRPQPNISQQQEPSAITDAAAPESIGMESTVIAQSLSNQKITCIEQDAQGQIWLGTFRGLNRYDSHEFHQYFCTDDSLQIPDNQITNIFRDSKERLWVATVNGVCRYTERDNFHPVPIGFGNKNVWQIVEDQDGRIIMSTGSQLYLYRPQTDSIVCIHPHIDPQFTMTNRIMVDKSNRLWVINHRYLSRYDFNDRQFKDSVALPIAAYHSYLRGEQLWMAGVNQLAVLDMRTLKPIALPDALTRNKGLMQADVDLIHPYGNTGLLLGTARHGMYYYNEAQGTVTRQDEAGFPFDIPKFKVNRMFTDAQQNIWMQSDDQGYAVAYHYKERFNNNNYLRSCFENKSVTDVAPGADNKLWIATLRHGLYLYDSNRQRVEHMDVESFYPNQSWRSIAVTQMLVDGHDDLWLSLSNNKLLRCSYTNGRLVKKDEFNIEFAKSLIQDEAGIIWVGTTTNKVYAFRPGANTPQMFQMHQHYSFIPGLLPLDDGRLLVLGFYMPPKVIDPRTNVISDFPIPEADQAQCIRRSVFIPTTVKRDSEGDIWIGTVSNGLLRYSINDKQVTPVPGTSCLDIASIEEDAQGHLWVGTQYGLNKWDRSTGRFVAYFANDGIGGNQFYDRATCRLADGTLVFGGTHGLTFFNPIDVQAKRHVPLLFQDLKIHNARISPDNEIIDRHLSHQPHIYLRYNDNSFSISFSALDYCEHERVHYQYKLEGYDKYWVEANNSHEAYYPNLPAGNYKLRVKISNNDRSIVETEKAICLTVATPPWNSWWAWLLYMATSGFLIYLFIRAWLKIRAEKAAAFMAEQEKEQEQRVNRMNMSFFANISHEFRTPLTMIAGPVQILQTDERLNDESRAMIGIIQRNVQRMLRLVNQLMDFNRLENDTLRLCVARTDIASVLHQWSDVFAVNARNKGISFTTYGLEEPLLTWADEDKVEKIFSNLMNNALKFTPPGGQIKVQLDVTSGQEIQTLFANRAGLPDKQAKAESEALPARHYLRIAVTNSGEDIPPTQREKIFDRYYQYDNSQGNYNWGTGIGLYYARALSRLHHGQLAAFEPHEGHGASFVFALPIDDEIYAADEHSADLPDQAHAYPLPVKEMHDMPEEKPSQPLVLIVDDDTEVVYYLQKLLSPHYRVMCRYDADSALKAMTDESPDLILSDVVMPGKTGYQLCEMVKTDLQLCHIPVILVTAKATVENQVEGLNTGADAYVTKPFDPNYLLALIGSQLRNREQTRQLLSRSTQTNEMEDDVLSPQDNAFMTELYRLLETELSNSEIDVTRVSEMMHTSRTKFYYKVKGLTGQTPNLFFKTYKLNRAAELLREGKYNVSEIADITGFSSLIYFSTSFKKQFGVVPSEYK